MFHLALTFGLQKDPPAALARMAGFVEATARRHGVAESLWMTLGLVPQASLLEIQGGELEVRPFQPAG